MYRNSGDLTFENVTNEWGLNYASFSNGDTYADLDNDGYRDFYIANGIFRRPNDLDYIKYISSRQIQESLEDGVEPENLALIQRMPELKIPNYVYRNNGDITFTNQSEQWGLDDQSFSNGATYSDLDNDGDLDWFVTSMRTGSSALSSRSARLPSRLHRK